MRLIASMKARLRDQRGFTLIEILMVITILALALVGLAATFGDASTLSVKSEAETAATATAHQEIEAYGNVPYNVTAPTSTAGSSGWSSTASSLGVPISTAEVSSTSPGIPRDGTWSTRTGISGSVYRYVTWVSGTNNTFKKLTVAVTATKLTNPVVLSVFRRDSDIGPGGNVGGGNPCTGQLIGVNCNP